MSVRRQVWPVAIAQNGAEIKKRRLNLINATLRAMMVDEVR